MSSLIDRNLSIKILMDTKQLIETRSWWKGIEGDLRNAVDINGRPTDCLNDIKDISGFTLAGAFIKSWTSVKADSTDTVSMAKELAQVYLEAAIRKSTGLAYSLHNLGKAKGMNLKRVLGIINDAIAGLKNNS